MSDPRHRGFAGAAAGAAPLAATADILRCYEEAVQEPLVECNNLDALYTHAQDDSSDRFDARILREDFCSTAVVAKTWLMLHQDNTAQGVDIDLDALQDTQRRVSDVALWQSPAYSGQACTKVVAERAGKAEAEAEAEAETGAEAEAEADEPRLRRSARHHDGDDDEEHSLLPPLRSSPTPVDPAHPIAAFETRERDGSARRAADVLRQTTAAAHGAQSMHKLAAHASRRAAAGFFFELLVLGSRGSVRLEQDEPYGDIAIHATPRLWT